MLQDVLEDEILRGILPPLGRLEDNFIEPCGTFHLPLGWGLAIWGIYNRVFSTDGMEGISSPMAKNLLIPHEEKSCPLDSSPKSFYSPHQRFIPH